MRVVDLPASLDFRTSEALIAEVSASGTEKILFDGRHLRWVDPNGMVILLATGAVARERSGELPRLELATVHPVAASMPPTRMRSTSRRRRSFCQTRAR